MVPCPLMVPLEAPQTGSAVKVAVDRVVHPVAANQVRKVRRLPLFVEGRIMEHDHPQPSGHIIHGPEGQAQPQLLPLEDLPVLALGKVG